MVAVSPVRAASASSLCRTQPPHEGTSQTGGAYSKIFGHFGSEMPRILTPFSHSYTPRSLRRSIQDPEAMYISETTARDIRGILGCVIGCCEDLFCCRGMQPPNVQFSKRAGRISNRTIGDCYRNS